MALQMDTGNIIKEKESLPVLERAKSHDLQVT
jgi:hypothetical protein